MEYHIYDHIIDLQKVVTKNEKKFTEKQLEEIRTHLMRARGVAAEAKA